MPGRKRKKTVKLARTFKRKKTVKLARTFKRKKTVKLARTFKRKKTVKLARTFKRKKTVKLARTFKRKFYRVLKHRATRELLICLLMVAVLYFGTMGVLILALRTDAPLLAVESGSMEPTFERGDLLIVRGIDDPVREIELRDIVVYDAASGNTTVHRVVVNEQTENWKRLVDGAWEFWIKGDAPTAAREWVKADQIRGKVISWFPKLGYISLWMRGA